jgi:hypothetical protein
MILWITLGALAAVIAILALILAGRRRKQGVEEEFRERLEGLKVESEGNRMERESEMKKTKHSEGTKTLSLILTFLLALSLIPATPMFAAPGDGANGAEPGVPAPSSGGTDVQTGDAVYFGRYAQEDLGTTAPSEGVEGTDWIGAQDALDGLTHYYAIEPIEWRVLENADGELFLLAEKKLDSAFYHEDNEDVTWEKSTVRSWLNGYGPTYHTGSSATDYSEYEAYGDNFIDTAFTASEKAAIVTSEVVNGLLTVGGKERNNGNDTQDKIFLLSVTEVGDASYGFDEGIEASETRTTENTGYGLHKYSEEFDRSWLAYSWWLRSLASLGADGGWNSPPTSRHFAFVSSNGSVNPNGYPAYPPTTAYGSSYNICVRPALRVPLSAVDLPSEAGNGGAITATDIADYSLTLNWKAATDSKTPTSDLRYFVYSSQQDNIATVKNCMTNGTLLNEGGTAGITSYEVKGLIAETTYYFNVVVMNTSGIRAAYATTSATTTNTGGIVNLKPGETFNFGHYPQTDLGTETPTEGTEGIDWVSTESAGVTHYYAIEPIKWRVLENADGELFLLSEKNLDATPYHENWASANGAVSWAQSTLRTWLNDTFADVAFTDAEQAMIANTDVDNGNSASTQDRIFLLSVAETQNTAYGFAAGTGALEARAATNTDYASIKTGGYTDWWLRTPGSGGSGYESAVLDGGGIYAYGYEAAIADIAATRPALKIDLSAVPGVTAQDNADISAAKTAIEEATFVAAQADVTTAAQAKTTVEAVIADLDLHGVQTTITDGTFTVAVAGAEAVPTGTDGSWTFVVDLAKGTGTPQTTETLTLAITATAYKAPSPGPQTGDTIFFGCYPQTNLGTTMPAEGTEGIDWVSAVSSGINGVTSYFKIEPIEWQVLENADEELFLLSVKNLDRKAYKTNWLSLGQSGLVTWETSTIRTWLNDDFANAAFTDDERAQITVSDLNNSDLTNGGNDTQDKIFLLSVADVQNTAYGFAAGTDASDTRRATNTGYLKHMQNEEFTDWWLRSPTIYSTNGRVMYVGGATGVLGHASPGETITMVRPALKLNLSALPGNAAQDNIDIAAAKTAVEEATFTAAQADVTTVGQARAVVESTVANLDLHGVKATVIGDTFTPAVTGTEATPEGVDGSWTFKIRLAKGIGTSQMIDTLTLVITATDYRDLPPGPQAGETLYFGRYPQTNLGTTIPAEGTEGVDWVSVVKNGVTSYFKIEPIEWRVLENNNGELFLLSVKNLDRKAYDENWTSFTASEWATWETSTIRTWLNGEFANVAFSDDEKAQIALSDVINSDVANGGNDTQDKVFLLSYAEARNEAYGFAVENIDDPARHSTNTGYVQSMTSAGDWWLRSPSTTTDGAMMWVRSWGTFVSTGQPNDATYMTVRPVINLLFSAPDTTVQDNADISTAKIAVEGATFTATQADITDATQAKTVAEAAIAALDLRGVTTTVQDGIFTPAVAGTAGTPAGTNGSYTFTVDLAKGTGTTQTTETLTLAITATAYDGLQTGDTLFFGRYPQTNLGTTMPTEGTENIDWVSAVKNGVTSYFKIEPIEWRVLENVDGELFLLSVKNLDRKPYDANWANLSDSGRATWETSTLRTWLNGEFANMAFTDDEKAQIVLSDVINSDVANGGADTQDKVFIPSYAEVRNEAYGFAATDSASPARVVTNTGYTTYLTIFPDWWLRTPSITNTAGSIVYVSGGNGQIMTGGISPRDPTTTVVRPAIKLAASVPDATAQDNIDISAAKIAVEGATYAATQTDVTDATPAKTAVEAAIAALDLNGVDATVTSGTFVAAVAGTALAPAGTNGSYTFTVELAKGAGTTQTTETLTLAIAATAYDDPQTGDTLFFGRYPQTNLGTTMPTEGTENIDWVSVAKNGVTSYFKIEPIEWRVLENADGELFLLSVKNLDRKAYDSNWVNFATSGWATWETSTIRTWLNGDFANAAFTGDEQAQLVLSSVINSDVANGGNDTTDKVFLLSVADAQNTAYGFAAENINDPARYATNTGYAQNMRTSTDWWLRSPSTATDGNMMYVEGNKGTITHYQPNDATYTMVRPAIKLAAPVPDTTVQDNADITAAKIAVEAATYAATQAEVTDVTQAKTAVEAIIAALDLNGVDATVTSGTFVAAVAGTAVSPAGAEGFWSFTVQLQKGMGTSQVTGTLILTIEQTAFDGVPSDPQSGDTVYFGRYPQTNLGATVPAFGTEGIDWATGVRFDVINYFKIEPLAWRVLENADGELFLLSVKSLDRKPFDSNWVDFATSGWTTWEISTIRTWLNDDFANVAFSDDEKAQIALSDVINSDVANGGNDTQDKVFLLSYAEVRNTAYGFAATDSTSPTRTSTTTGYLSYMTSYSDWWLRSPFTANGTMRYVNGGNGAISSFAPRDATYTTVRPAIKLAAPVPDTTVQDNADIQAAKIAVEGATYAATQTDVTDVTQAKTAVEAVIAALDLNGVDATVQGGVFTAATAGTAQTPAGTNGSYAFTVDLAKGTGTTQTTGTLTLAIAATAYDSTPQDNTDISTAKIAVEGASYTATQANVTDVTQAKTAVEAAIAALDLNGVIATVQDGTFTPATAGTAGTPAGTNGSYTFTVQLTKGTGTTQTTETLTLAIAAIAYDSTAQDNADISAAKIVVEGATFTAAQTDVTDAVQAKTAVESVIAALDLSGVTATVTSGTFVAAIAGAAQTPTGTNGSYTFTVNLAKGTGTTQTTETLTLAISATAYDSTTQDNIDISAAKITVEGAAYAAVQADVTDVTQAKTAVEAAIAALDLNGVTATVQDGVFTAAIAGTAQTPAGTNGSYTFTVQLAKGTGTAQTTTTLTLTIAATAYDSTAQDNADIQAAKTALEAAIYMAAQTDVSDIVQAKSAVEIAIAALDLNGVQATVQDGTFSAAIAGTAQVPAGTNGSYTFTVDLAKGTGTTQTTETLILVISATAYDSTAQDNADIQAAKTALEAAIFTATQANVTTAVQAKSAVETAIAALDLNGVQATVQDDTFTAAIAGTAQTPAGTNGSYTFTVDLAKGTGATQTTETLTLVIAATAYSGSVDNPPGGTTNNTTNNTTGGTTNNYYYYNSTGTGSSNNAGTNSNAAANDDNAANANTSSTTVTPDRRATPADTATTDRSNNTDSAPIADTQTPQTAAQDTADGGGINTVLLVLCIVLGAIALALAGGMGFVLGRSGRARREEI